jgi:glycosyltransferase involved in cell wall biosynthesis
MVPVKGLDVLLDACSELVRRGVDFHLHLLGEGPLRPALEAQCAALGLCRHITFAGGMAHERLADWYRAADLTVLASHSEGIPNVLLESLACGTQFIATRVGGIPEIAHGQISPLPPAGDAAALAEAIIAGLKGNTARRESWFSPISWQESAEGVMRVFQRILFEGGRGSCRAGETAYVAKTS